MTCGSTEMSINCIARLILAFALQHLCRKELSCLDFRPPIIYSNFHRVCQAIQNLKTIQNHSHDTATTYNHPYWTTNSKCCRLLNHKKDRCRSFSQRLSPMVFPHPEPHPELRIKAPSPRAGDLPRPRGHGDGRRSIDKCCDKCYDKCYDKCMRRL